MSDAFSVTCPHCDAQLKLKNRAALGKRAPCPKCGERFLVEENPPEDEYDFLTDEELAEEDYGQPLPPAAPAPARSRSSSGKKKKTRGRQSSGSGLLFPLLIGGGVLTLFLLAGLGVWLIGMPGESDPGNRIDLTYLPHDADLVVQVRAAEAWNAPLVQTLLNNPQVRPQIDQLRQQIGLDPGDVERLTIGVTGFGRQMKAMADYQQQVREAAQAGPGNLPPPPEVDMQTIVVVRAAAPVDTQTIADQGRFSEAVDHLGSQYQRQAGPGDKPAAMWAVDERTLLFGPERDIRAAIERGTDVQRRPDLDFIDPDHQLLVVLAPQDSSVFNQDPAATSPIELPESVTRLATATNDRVRAMTLVADAADELGVGMSYACLDNGAAAQIAAEYQQSIQELQDSFAKTKTQLPDQFAEVVGVVDNVLGSMQARSEGGQVEMALTVPANVGSAVEQLPGLMMFAMMQGGGFGNMPGVANMPAGGGLPQSLGEDFDPQTVDLSALEAPAAAGQGGSLPNPFGEAREAARRTQCKNNLKMIVLAMHNYHDAHRSFPKLVRNQQTGEPLLSWRVALLPFLDQRELYEQFHLDEPWNSEHNQTLIAKIPAALRCPSAGAPAGKTTYCTIRGPGAVYEGGDGRHLRDVRDGSSNTLLVVDVAAERAVVWTQPEDFEYQPDNPFDGLLGHHDGGFQAVFCDGHVAFLSATLAPQMLVHLFQRNDGQQLDLN